MISSVIAARGGSWIRLIDNLAEGDPVAWGLLGVAVVCAIIYTVYQSRTQA